MSNSVYVTLSQQMVLRRQMDIIANNIANSSTTAFKSEQPLFEEFLVKTADGRSVSYVHDFGTIRDLDEGAFAPTSSPFDLAMHGQGYFAVETPDGVRYTRNGHFITNEESELVTSSGHPVLDIDGNVIVIDPTAVPFTVSTDGTISGELGDPVRLQIVKFDDEQRLKKVSDGLYSTIQNPIPADELEEGEEPIRIVQYMLEQSNVEPIIEMSAMIQVHRSYQSASKVNSTDHDMQRKMIDTISRAA